MSILSLLAKVTESDGEKAAFVAALDVLRQTIRGHYYSALYGRMGCAAVDVYHPGEGWLGLDSEIARRIATHHSSHPFCKEFFFSFQSAVYQRSLLIADSEWQKSAIYRLLDSTLGIEDMIGLYFPMPSGQFGAIFCGTDSSFDPRALSHAQALQQVLRPLLATIQESSLQDEASEGSHSALTQREEDVLKWLGHGKSNQEIAIILGISPHTVRKHMEHIFRKLGVENRTAAVREARDGRRLVSRQP